MTISEKKAMQLRNYLRGLSRRRSDGVVTADDAHNFLGRNGIDEMKVRTRLSYINTVLREPNFEPVGYRQSSREVARGRTITEWVTAE